MTKKLLLILIALTVSASNGCGRRKRAEQTKQPRPVDVQTLRLQLPPSSKLVSASVGSWKTEEIGFEVSGRVESVVEPTVSVEGRITRQTTVEKIVDGKTLEETITETIIEGTPIGKLEDERYRLQVQIARAEVARAQQNVEAATIELNKSLPAQLRAARAEKTLAELELARQEKLGSLDAGSQADIDRADAQFASASAAVDQLDASIKAKEADLQSLELQVRQAKQSLRDAERSLRDCTLYSSFRGQVADVSIVPGSVVTAGQPAVTVQMMDPIKVELEVSAEDSRRLQRRQLVNVFVTQADGTVETHDGFLYQIDALADSSTRTFTVTLLLRNRRGGLKQQLEDTGTQTLPVTDQVWPVDFTFLPGAEEGRYFAEQDTIHGADDPEGPYVWRVQNMKKADALPPDRILKVSKMRVDIPGFSVPFLGNWLFKEVVFLDDTFDPTTDVISGKLVFESNDNQEWDGDSILVNRGRQWMVRPGDIVKVDLSQDEVTEGFFVPMDAISRQSDKTYLFVVDSSTDPPTVKQTEIIVSEPKESTTTSSMRRIQAADNTANLDGIQYVVRGTHYLRNNEPVKVVAASEVTP